jgi:DNA-binding XRE family transcriptional regulator
MPAGRPTDYTPELLQKAQEYADLASNRALDGEDRATASVAELALHLDVSRSTVYKWSEEHKEFSDILEKILTAQELALIDNGLRGTFNSTITKLMLTKHGYTDKQETDLTSKGESINPLTVRFIDATKGDSDGHPG